MPDPLLVVQLDASDPPARLGVWLADTGLDLDVRKLDVDDALPPSLDEHAGVVVLGGPMGALDDVDYPYLADVRGLLCDAVVGEVPTLGVCLGHQLLAAAHGGQVRRNPAGPEIGAQLVAKRTAAGRDPLFAAVPITPDVLQWHFDEVSVLPPGAIQLASSPGCEQQAFRLGRLAWGIQFHIETTPEIVQAWADQDSDELVDYDLDAIVERAVVAHADIAETWRPFAASFDDIVRHTDAVPPPRTLPTATAAPVTDPAAIRAALAAELSASRTPLPTPGPRPDDD